MSAGADLAVMLRGQNLLGPVLKEAAKQTQDFGKSIDDVNVKGGRHQTMLGGLVDGLGKIGLAGLGAKLAFDAVSGVVGGLTADFIEAEKITAATNAVLLSTGGVAGMTADSISELAGSLSKVAPFEDDAIQGAENLLLTFTSIGKDVFPQATETVLNMSQALGQDLKSSAIQLGKALQDPITGATALRRVGVNLADSQMDLIKGFMATNDLASAQGVILKELETEFGGAARAAGQTFAGKMTILNTQIGNVKETIGAALIPILSDLLERAMPLIQAFGEWLPTGIDQAKTVINGAVGVVKDFLGYLDPGNQQDVMRAWFGEDFGPRIDEAVRALKGVVAVVGDNLKPILIGLGATIGIIVVPAFIAWAVAAGAAAVATIAALAPVLVPIAAIGAAVALLAVAWENNFMGIKDVIMSFWAEVEPKFAAAWGNIQTWTNAAVNFIAQAVSWLSGVWSDHWTQISGILQGAWDVMQGIVQIAWSIISGIVKVGLDVLSGDWSAAWTDIKGMFAGIWDGMTLVLQGFLGIWKNELSLAWDGIKAGLSAAWGGISGLLGSILSGITNMLKNKVNEWIDTINGIINGFNSVPGVPSIPNIPRLAAGGTVTAGGLALVGERGPEVLALPRGASVAPLDSGGGLGGIAVHIYNPILLGRDSDVARQLADLIEPELRRKIYLSMG